MNDALSDFTHNDPILYASVNYMGVSCVVFLTLAQTLTVLPTMQTALQQEGLQVDSVQINSAAPEMPSLASTLCLSQNSGYCTGVPPL